MADMSDQPASLPPYTAFNTFWGFVEELSQRGPLPQVLDRQMFGARSDAGAYELTQALKSLGLIDQEKRPTERGREFLAGPTPELLGRILTERYPEAIALGLETATIGQLTEVLRAMGMKDGSATLRKARTFFIQAADRAGMDIGPHLRVSAPRGGSRQARRAKPAPSNNGDKRPQPASVDLRTRYVELLMDKVKAQEEPDAALLDRIERALEIATSPSFVQTTASEQG